MTKFSKPFVAASIVALSALLLASCRAEEQGRPLTYKKGEYTGPKGEKLSDATMAELRARAMLQGGGSAGGAGAVQTTGTDVRLDPPKK